MPFRRINDSPERVLQQAGESNLSDQILSACLEDGQHVCFPEQFCGALGAINAYSALVSHECKILVGGVDAKLS